MDSLDEAFDNIGIDMENYEDTAKKLIEESEKSGISITQDNKLNIKADKLCYDIKGSDRDQAVYESIIPKTYRNSTFDTEKIRTNLQSQYLKSGKLYKTYGFTSYINLCEDILSTVRMKMLPIRSYLIGAPNGFGKTSFVSECLITLKKQGYKVAPYISLWELAQIRVENEHRIMNPYKKFREEKREYDYTEPNKTVGYQKKPEIITGKYSYSEYINADCLFVSFTDVISKDIESHTLYQLLSIRGAKGLPTIVMMSTSLDPYENDRTLREQVWSEIKICNEIDNCYDRMIHVSCYRRKNIGLDNKDEIVDKETGVVQ